MFINTIWKIKQHANTKTYQALSSLSLNDVGIYPQDGPFSSDTGIVNLHPSKGTQRVCYINENYFDSCGWSPPEKLSIKRNGHCLYSEYKIEDLANKQDFECVSYCL